MTSHYDIVIVGGGIVGSMTAYSLGQRDATLRIAVIEADPTYARASTPKASGVVRHQFGAPENIRMCVESSKFFANAPELLAVDGEPAPIGWGERGYVWLVPPDLIETVEGLRQIQIANGAAVDFLDRAALKARWPQFEVEAFGGGFAGAKGAGWLDPWALLQATKRKAIAQGVTFIADRVTGLTRNGRRIEAVTTASGRTLSCGHAVNAAGALGASKVAAMAGVPLTIEQRKRCVFVVACRESMRRLPMTVHPKTGVWFRPEGSGFICGVAPKPEDDPATDDLTVDDALFEEIIWPTMAEIVPAFESLKVVSTYSCFYDFNPLDENAILGPPPELDNFMIATGFSGHGVMQAPATGRAIAELILDGRYTTLDLTRFGYDRITRGEALPEPACF
ncbi:MAG: FAD-dependent oxidoreductase [Hyphomicrobiaceae bacterium]